MICSANSRNQRRRHLLSSRLLGCLQRSRGSFRFRAQPSSIALRKTSERRMSTLHLKISVPSKVPPQASRSKGLGIRNGLSRRPDGEWLSPPFYPTRVLRQNPSEALPPRSGSRAKVLIRANQIQELVVVPRRRKGKEELVRAGLRIADECQSACIRQLCVAK